ncbi:hypothetical protein TSUD_280510 [Trifolium subterraneum]|uniref:Uncharacterized protein n=1 Tax=Trifolium subterraneum TaxID=3900 RepID=A0A2Z6P8W1_TRISU|nr:hypothetical protein TSUD_280510 [Trifolium subterraneum]
MGQTSELRPPLTQRNTISSNKDQPLLQILTRKKSILPYNLVTHSPTLVKSTNNRSPAKGFPNSSLLNGEFDATTSAMAERDDSYVLHPIFPYANNEDEESMVAETQHLEYDSMGT